MSLAPQAGQPEKTEASSAGASAEDGIGSPIVSEPDMVDAADVSTASHEVKKSEDAGDMVCVRADLGPTGSREMEQRNPKDKKSRERSPDSTGHLSDTCESGSKIARVTQSSPSSMCLPKDAEEDHSVTMEGAADCGSNPSTPISCSKVEESVVFDYDEKMGKPQEVTVVTPPDAQEDCVEATEENKPCAGTSSEVKETEE